MILPILIALVPIFMLLDYALAVIELKGYRKTYGKHIVIEERKSTSSVEKAREEGRLINPATLISTIFVTGCLLAVFWLEEGPTFPALLGFLLCIPLIGIATRLAHILFYQYVDTHAQEVTGEAKLSHHLALALNFYRLLVPFLILGLVALVNPSPFTIGCFAAPVALALRYGLLIYETRN